MDALGGAFGVGGNVRNCWNAPASRETPGELCSLLYGAHLLFLCARHWLCAGRFLVSRERAVSCWSGCLLCPAGVSPGGIQRISGIRDIAGAVSYPSAQLTALWSQFAGKQGVAVCLKNAAFRNRANKVSQIGKLIFARRVGRRVWRWRVWGRYPSEEGSEIQQRLLTPGRSVGFVEEDLALAP